MEDQLVELLPFLHDRNPSVRQIALQNLVGHSSATSPMRKIFEREGVIRDLKLLARDQPMIAHDAFSALINLSSSTLHSSSISSPDFLLFLVSYIINPSSTLSDLATMLLSNLSKLPTVANALLALSIPVVLTEGMDPVWVGARSGSAVLGVQRPGKGEERMVRAMPCLVEAFVQGAAAPEKAEEAEGKEVKRKGTCHFLASVFANITATPAGREYFTTPSPTYASLINPSSTEGPDYPLRQLLIFTDHANTIRRGGVTSTIKNAAFHKPSHRALLAEEDKTVGGAPGLNILPSLLYPLCGPEEFDLDDQDALPANCQFLPSTKVREPDAALRLTHVETLVLLCTTLAGRETLRKNGTYTVIKAMHAAEKDEKVGDEVIKLVNLIMREEGDETKVEELDAQETTEVDEDMVLEEV